MDRQRESAQLEGMSFATDSFVVTLGKLCREGGRFHANMVTCSNCLHPHLALWPGVAGTNAIMCPGCRQQGYCAEINPRPAPAIGSVPPDSYHTGRLMFSLGEACKLYGRFHVNNLRCSRCKTEQIVCWPGSVDAQDATCPCCLQKHTSTEVDSREAMTEREMRGYASSFDNHEPLFLEP